MIPNAIQPWGRAPTPLIPKSILKEYGYLDAPQTLKETLGYHATLAELNGDIWNSIDSVNGECLAEIVDILRPHFNKFKHLYIYPDKQLPQSLETLPFSTRTKNAVIANPDKFSEPQLRFNDLISITSFGVRSAIEFACVIESVLVNASELVFSHKKIDHSENEKKAEFSKINSFFQLLSAWALGEQKLMTLSGALPVPLPEWPLEIKQIWNELENLNTSELAGEVTKCYSVSKLITQELGSLDERSLYIVNKRIFAVEHAATLEELGSKFGITRERVRQIEQKALLKLERFRSNEYLPVLRRAESLSNRIGCAVQIKHPALEDALNWAVEDIEENGSVKQLAKSLLLWLAGPYKVYQNWLLKDVGLGEHTTNTFLQCRDHRGMINENTAQEIMNNLGIKIEHHQSWLKHLLKFLRVDGGLIYFQGNILDKAYALLQYFAKPMTVEEMLEYIGSDSDRSFRQRLIDDPRFWRINKQNEFVLANTEGYDEYTGITDEIIQELELCGGQASISYLVEKLSRIYGVKENSIVAYLNTPMFTKDENGNVRVRDTEDIIDIKTDISKSAACYLLNDDAWCWRIKIDKDALRGSGRVIPNAFAMKLGCNLGKKISVPTEFGEITLSWPLTSTTGAYIGSLRQVLDYHGVAIGDYLFLNATSPYVTFSCLKQDKLNIEDSNLVKLALLLGATNCDTENEALFKIATALDIKQTSKETILTEASQKLTSKGEIDLCQLIQKPKLSVDDYINDMGRLFR